MFGDLLERLGLGRPELRAWALYDWANSAFITVVITAVYPIFFQRTAAVDLPGSEATAAHAVATFWALAAIAVASPFLGALADQSGARKKLFSVFLVVGVGATACLALVAEGEWRLASALFILANVGAVGSFVFYDSLLPHLAGEGEVDKVSTAGYALGYLGGGLVLAASLLVIQRPDLLGLPGAAGAARASFLLVAVWWAVFSIPLLRRVPEPPLEGASEQSLGALLSGAVGRLGETFRELRRFRQAFLLMLAVMIYNDGIGTIIRMATIYGAEIGLPDGSLIAAILLVQFLGIPFAFLFGSLAGRIGPKRSILLGLTVYLGISVLGYFMRSVAHFYVLAALVAMVQGGTQALSRSLFATLIPRRKSSEFFGFFAVFEKFAGTLGPLVFFWVIQLTGSSRNAVLAVIAFFVVGGALLLGVNVEEGRWEARLAEAEDKA